MEGLFCYNMGGGEQSGKRAWNQGEGKIPEPEELYHKKMKKSFPSLITMDTRTGWGKFGLPDITPGKFFWLVVLTALRECPARNCTPRSFSARQKSRRKWRRRRQGGKKVHSKFHSL